MSARPGGGAGTSTPMAVLVLGLLVERPMHAYEMLQTLLQRGQGRFVNLRPGSLYHTVDRLRERNLLQVNDVQREGNRPERTVYTITEAGTKELATTLSTMLCTPAVEFPELYLALAEAHTLERDAVVDLLDHRLAVMRTELADVTQVMSEAAAAGRPEMFLLDFGCRRAVLDAQITWLSDLRARLADGELMWLDEFKKTKQFMSDTGCAVPGMGHVSGRSDRSQDEVTTHE